MVVRCQASDVNGYSRPGTAERLLDVKLSPNSDELGVKAQSKALGQRLDLAVAQLPAGVSYD